jgi:hypothetical protein
MSKVEILDLDAIITLLERFGFNALVILILVRCFYYPTTRRKDYLFTYILIGFTVFLLCFMLSDVKLELGFALGLFAIFGIIKYRTDSIPIKEMTYLFVIIAVSVINALATNGISYVEIVITNLLIIAVTFGLERIWLLKNEVSKLVVYERIEMIKPDQVLSLKDDLQKRTGLQINKIRIGDIDFVKARVIITIYYYESENGHLKSP